jgi:membrane protein implicated in regulation of membrane protease activity
MSLALLLADFFGISNGTFLHWMLAISLTLLVLDVFCNTEVLSWISMLVFSLWATMQFDLPVQWMVLVYVLVLILCAVLYYTLWTHCVRRLVMDGVMRNAPREAQENLAGTAGRIVGEGDSLSVKYGDQYLPLADSCRAAFSAGDEVTITAVKDGQATVQRRES